MSDETYPPDEVDYARSMITCPYRMGIGICASGCRTEPACQTDEPLEGWQHILDHAETADAAGYMGVTGGCACEPNGTDELACHDPSTGRPLCQPREDA